MSRCERLPATMSGARSRRSPELTLLIASLACIALASSIGTTPAQAQCAPFGDTAAAVGAAASVFVGEVRSVETDDRIVTMEVLSVWKGRDLPAHVEVRGTTTYGAAPAATDRRFEAGARYLVIPENSRSPFLATSCSATQRFSGSPGLIPQSLQDAAGTASGRAPLGPDPVDVEAAVSRSVLPLIGAIGLIALTWAAILWMRSKGPERIQPAAASQPQPKPEEKPRRFKKRSLKRDSRRKGTTALRRVKQNRRRWRQRRRRETQELVGASATAKGSTDTS